MGFRISSEGQFVFQVPEGPRASIGAGILFGNIIVVT